MNLVSNPYTTIFFPGRGGLNFPMPPCIPTFPYPFPLPPVFPR